MWLQLVGNGIFAREISVGTPPSKWALTWGVAFSPHIVGQLYLMLVLYTSGATGQVWPATSTSIYEMFS